MLKVLLVDDEPLARDGLRMQLDKEDDIVILGECGSGSEAIDAIQDLEPDLVFLDIRMPQVGGFEVIEAVGPERMPPVVFLTAYDAHAVAAFEVRALDYLLKPLDPRRLSACLERVRGELQQRSVSERARQLREVLDAGVTPESRKAADRIVVRSGGHVHFLKPAEIAWVEAAGDYVTLHVGERQHLLRETMTRMEKRLLEHGFRRTHRSSIVNLDYISELIASESGDYRVVLTTGVTLKLSRHYRDDLYAAMSA